MIVEILKSLERMLDSWAGMAIVVTLCFIALSAVPLAYKYADRIMWCLEEMVK